MSRPLCTNGKWNVDTVPCQIERVKDIPRAYAEAAYVEYASQYGTSQSFDRLCERGGFGLVEMIGLLVERVARLEGLGERLARLEDIVAQARVAAPGDE